ncbi:MAG: hypothetical protein FJ100_05190 [Deltaproteobacteria bacterium]|nr:hypothetical protein [Deltaproteobacteria bacterium]
MKTRACLQAQIAVAALAWACGDDAAVKAPTLGTAADGTVTGDLVFADGTAPRADAEAADSGTGGDAAPGVPDAAGDGGAVDDGGDDTAPCPGSVGCACYKDDNCPTASACVATASGKQCAAPCLSGQPCAPGTVCLTLPGADTASAADDKPVCVPKWPHLCDPCASAATCGLGDGGAGACVSIDVTPGAKGWQCSSACSDDSKCPSGYHCGTATAVGGFVGPYCLPNAGQCACSDSAVQKGLTTPCASAATLPDGTPIQCVGVRTCDAATGKLGACSASSPKKEICNGLDDDCNGLTDEAASCDDDNACTDDACEKGSCAFIANAQGCNDGDACTTADACATGKCTGGKPADCEDKNPCTTDSCSPSSGCAHAPNAAACDDGDACTANDACVAGQCAAGANTCPCQTDGDCATKDDKNPCNGSLYCAKASAPFVCKVNPATVITCNPKDDTVCAVATCDPKDGKCKPQAQNDGKPCDDGSACSNADQCKAGKCGGSVTPCDDGNACTDDACDAKKGCTHKPNKAACDDGDACTTGDGCADAACKATPKACNDGFACTTDSCDKATGGCQITPGTTPGCGKAILPYAHQFNCGTPGLDQWQLSDWALPAGSVRWAFDATGPLPGVTGQTCSLNLNNGKDLACPAGQGALAATADSPWFDATKVAAKSPVVVRVTSAGNWTAQHVAKVQVRLADGLWTDLATAPTPTGTAQTVQWPVPGGAGTGFQVRFSFSGPCAPGAIGWFLDDFAVFEDLCATGNGGCMPDQLCSIDAKMLVVCNACKPGFVFKDGGCTDVDECAKPGACAAEATCTNAVGSFSCACKAGYAGDGKTCKDVDECATGKATCGANTTCLNTPGGWECKCAPNTVGVGNACYKKGFDAKAPATHCLEVLTLHPGSPDGSYWIDPDGAGPVPATQYTCDMKNGGWTLLIFDDFEDGALKGWSAGKVEACGEFGKMLGGPGVFGKGAAVSKSVLAPSHTQAKLFMHYISGDSWDGETGLVQVNGNTVFSKKGQLGVIGNKCGDWLWDDDKWDVAWTGPHTASPLVVLATSTLDQPADNEWFAIDNVVVWVK